MNISLFAPTAVVVTRHVPADADVLHENDPAVADPQLATDGLAAVPIAAQLVGVTLLATQPHVSDVPDPVQFRLPVPTAPGRTIL